jgi:hypothetical protein
VLLCVCCCLSCRRGVAGHARCATGMRPCKAWHSRVRPAACPQHPLQQMTHRAVQGSSACGSTLHPAACSTMQAALKPPAAPHCSKVLAAKRLRPLLYWTCGCAQSLWSPARTRHPAGAAFHARLAPVRPRASACTGAPSSAGSHSGHPLLERLGRGLLNAG